ncbi:broad specificity phosphatase PhoE [Georgenia soli]|uniref:phosphoglycerate mutase (2,3-diphosphoglycerate-dependent) n=1 Tax=Georgenia soli TaxID=638953 RepID=A0A2A9EK01_9MICO|nr:histidine phosphatase family protein [Georgenia soli]PFG39228.1 broad specificity phosphatase PhoE [Georgenia soli]
MGVTEILLVRHGESAANIAASRAEAAGAETIDVPARDPDVQLSAAGQAQAEALGAWLRDLPDDRRPDVVWSSPYRRALDTARTALRVADADVPLRVDERLRDRDLGITDTLTTAGVLARFPEEAERRRWLGKFYHRPPGGESWADVALRVRTVLADLERQSRHRRVLVTCHDVVVLVFRYVCEQLDEERVLEIGRTEGVRNASVTRLVHDGEDWHLADYNLDAHLRQEHAPRTDEPSAVREVR